jgi:hypothetical protein
MSRFALSLAFALLVLPAAFARAGPAQLTRAVTAPLTLDEATLEALRQNSGDL